MFTVRFTQSALHICRRASAVIPQWPQQWLLCAGLNHLLRDSRLTGDFDFLLGKTLTIEILDYQQTYPLTLVQTRFARSRHKTDTQIAANLSDLLKMIVGQEDPDSLFFQRRLRICGDTALGLTAKNTLDAIDKNQLPPALRRRLAQIIQLLEWAESPHTEIHDGTGMSSR